METDEKVMPGQMGQPIRVIGSIRPCATGVGSGSTEAGGVTGAEPAVISRYLLLVYCWL